MTATQHEVAAREPRTEVGVHEPPVGRWGVAVYRPRAGRSIRPPDLEPAQREHVRAADPERREASRWRRVLELPALIVVALVLAFLIKTFLVQAFYIPSGSMTETLAINDRVLVEKVTYRFRDPERGEVIVFRRPGLEETRDGLGGLMRSFLEGLGVVPPDAEIDLIKRVVALPGETVEIIEGVVHIDGTPVDEPYASVDQRDYEAVEVPDGEYFMLGDNRSNSDDSRYSLGTVPRETVVGRAFLILWPPGRATFALDHDYPEPLTGLGHGDVPLGLMDATVLSSSVGASGASFPVPARPAPHAERRRLVP